ncbi:MAG: hypothetical protein M3125_05935 [Gemmatimonadota bacterium]|nr:hypothetical protein [Gemmatimonadota bacterium]
MTNFAAELLAVERALSARPVDHVALRDAVAAYARARRADATPEGVIRDLKRAFEPLIQEGHAEAFTLRTDAVTLAISIYYRGTRSE